MPSPSSRRPLRSWLIALAVLVVLVGGAVAFVLLHSPGNVSNPHVEFTAPTVATSPPRKHKPVLIDSFVWGRYGYDLGRTRFFPNSQKLDPPFTRGWSYYGSSLLEFSPVIYHTRLFFLNDSGVVVALDKRTGHILWKKHVGTLAAASPAVAGNMLYAPLLSTNPNPGQTVGNGRFVALSQKTGRVIWSRPIPPGSESSPTVWHGNVYFGDQNGTVYALGASSGHELWTYHASGAVKGGPSIADGNLYFGDYSGHAYALNAQTGHQVWAVGTNGTRFGFGSGNFYSTPAVAFGRVYMGNTDGRVYSFGVHTGALAWATSTGAYVYASAAVADTPGLGPTVYIGSYDGNFYAFNAQTGGIRWTHPAGGKISGSPTIVGNVVYYADLATKSTAGLDVRTGHQVYSFPAGSFNPVIADPNAVYVTGYADLFELLPKRAARHSGRAKGAAAAAGAARAAKSAKKPQKAAAH